MGGFLFSSLFVFLYSLVTSHHILPVYFLVAYGFPFFCFNILSSYLLIKKREKKIPGC